MGSVTSITAASRTAARRSSDAALVDAAQAGDQQALADLLKRYRGLLEHQARRLYLPGGDRDDILQVARIALAKAIHSYRGGHGSSFHTFAELCVTRAVATALKQARRLKQQALNEAITGEAAEHAWANLHSHEDPVDAVLADERLRALATESQRFSDLERSVMAYALAGWSTGETARKLQVEPKCAQNALRRVQGKLEDWQERRAA